MRYTPRQYAEALLKALKEKKVSEQKKIMTGFLNVLRRKGDYQQIPRVLRVFEKIYWSNQGKKKVLVEYPDELAKEVRKEIENILGKKIVLSECKKPELLAGVRILVDDELMIDSSGKYFLNKLISG